jgi:hypothetical protein
LTMKLGSSASDSSTPFAAAPSTDARLALQAPATTSAGTSQKTQVRFKLAQTLALEAMGEADALLSSPLGMAFAGLFGAASGSFFNVCIERVPKGQSVAFPGSRCSSCGVPVRASDNIPILSYFDPRYGAEWGGPRGWYGGWLEPGAGHLLQIRFGRSSTRAYRWLRRAAAQTLLIPVEAKRKGAASTTPSSPAR